MAKNNVSAAKTLADIANNKRSRAYKELLEICWDNDAQTDSDAERLRGELNTVLKGLLKGDFEPCNRKLAAHRKASPLVVVRTLASDREHSGSIYSTVKSIRIGQSIVSLHTFHSSEATPEELIYALLRRALETRDIQRLDLCPVCGKVFYRKSLKGRFCRKDCRWAHFNSPDERHKRYARLVKDRRGLIARRRAKSAPKRPK